MSSAPARFTFDLDLGRREERNRVLTEGALAEMLKTARTEGYAHGHADGERSAATHAAQLVAAAAASLADRAAAMNDVLEAAQRMARAEAADLALVIARKLALHLIARQPAAELEALIEECLANLEGVPHLVIRCHPDLAENVRQAAEARMALSSFTGRLVVIGDPEVTLSDGRIEWADGGVVRDLDAISNKIETAISTYLRAAGGDVPEETTT